MTFLDNLDRAAVWCLHTKNHEQSQVAVPIGTFGDSRLVGPRVGVCKIGHKTLPVTEEEK